MKYPILTEARDVIRQAYYVEEREENAIAISTAPDELPFAFVVIEDKSPDIFLISLRVGFNDPIVVADIALVLNNIAPLEIVEEFYLAEQEEEVFWGKEAHKKVFEKEHQDFLNLQPINDLKH
jgi:hypothetical protein